MQRDKIYNVGVGVVVVEAVVLLVGQDPDCSS